MSSPLLRRLGPAIAIMIVLAAPLLPPWRAHVRTMMALINFAVESGDWRPLERTTPTPIVSTYHLDEDAASLPFDVYLPGDGRTDLTSIILYTPVLKDVRNNNKIKNIADTLARVGFAVVVLDNPPDLSPFNDAEVPRLKRLTQFLLKSEPLGIARVGFFSICYGNGAAFAAAADPEISAHVSFIFAFASHYDMGNAFDYLLTHRYEYNGIDITSDPNFGARMLLIAFFGKAGMTTKTFRTSQIFMTARERLSPMFYVDGLQGHIYLLHATDDTYIPFTESMRLYDDLIRHNKAATLVLTDVLRHSGLRPVTTESVRRYYAKDGLLFYIFLHRFLSQEV